MAYYTALSRSASAEGTIIIQEFDSKVISRGCSGYLRQEFREMELLDDITRLKYVGQLPDDISGSLRNDLIFQFRQWKGQHYVPAKTDKPLKWSASDPLDLAPGGDRIYKTGLCSQAKSTSVFVSAKGSKSVIRSPHSPTSSQPSRKQQIAKSDSESESEDQVNGPIGLDWDGD